ncbi:LOW QUALITY PROTEIN: uncharacterized protein LOC110032872 [Phalaenopsis equestris]|uniref:LOW QUALITY PROTEIN: uncharacterized protein LOC110032872 n=1 Tax=Phalaenopsis equestris TaxID=78828 RepID=UPI0009E291B9|nr:LOW QUALITY PROTEIN: uncharacterized protein LOC110032872 [Phalaenopsis equestris]
MKVHEIEEVISVHNIIGSTGNSLWQRSFLQSSKSREVKDKIGWVRSQLIGEDVKLTTPFGNRRLTYADHTATGRPLLCVENYITEHVLPFYGNTHTSDSFVGQRTTRMVKQATEYVKKCVRAGPDSAIIFCGSGATAAVKGCRRVNRLQEMMGIAVPSNLKERAVLAEEDKWVVFVGPWEHHSNLLSWRQTTADVVEIGLDDNTGLVDMEELETKLGRMMRANRRMLGSFSACSNVTGVLCDTRAIARLLHQYGAFACFDFATSFPADNSEKKEAGKPLSGRFVAKLLNDLFGIQARGGCSCAGPYGHYLLGVDENLSLGIRSFVQKGYEGLKPGWTRVSFSYYMTGQKFNFILSAIEFIAANGHRFLSLYDFDWRTGDWAYGKPLIPNYITGIKKGKIKEMIGFQKRKESNRFAKYLKRASKIVVSLPEKPRTRKVPEGVDSDMILFMI